MIKVIYRLVLFRSLRSLWLQVFRGVTENWKLEKLKAQDCYNQGLIENLWKIVWSIPTNQQKATHKIPEQHER